MLTKKFLASAVATIATAGAIGVAIAQTTDATKPPLNTTSDNSNSRSTAGVDSTGSSSTNAPSGDSTSSTTGSTMSASTGAGSTVSAEATPRADRN